MPFLQSLSFYHSLISISWPKFNIIIILSYAAINLVFAFMYLLVGYQHLAGITGGTFLERFWDMFFFSVQTFTTVGYGRINPVGFWSSALASIESLVGLMGLAFATGLLYGRFSKPNAKLIYSEKAVIAPYKDITAFEFRIANARKNQLIEAEAQVVLSWKENIDGRRERKFHELELERKKVNFFALSWTVVHPIGENSPLYGITKKELDASDAEFLILFKAFDDTFSQTVHARSSYKFHEIAWNAKFANIFVDSEKGITVIDIGKIHQIEDI